MWWPQQGHSGKFIVRTAVKAGKVLGRYEGSHLGEFMHRRAAARDKPQSGEVRVKSRGHFLFFWTSTAWGLNC